MVHSNTVELDDVVVDLRKKSRSLAEDLIQERPQCRVLNFVQVVRVEEVVHVDLQLAVPLLDVVPLILVLFERRGQLGKHAKQTR